MLLRPFKWTFIIDGSGAAVQDLCIIVSKSCGNTASAVSHPRSLDPAQEIRLFEEEYELKATRATKRHKRVTRKPVFLSYPRSVRPLAMGLWKDF